MSKHTFYLQNPSIYQFQLYFLYLLICQIKWVWDSSQIQQTIRFSICKSWDIGCTPPFWTVLITWYPYCTHSKQYCSVCISTANIYFLLWCPITIETGYIHLLHNDVTIAHCLIILTAIVIRWKVRIMNLWSFEVFPHYHFTFTILDF